MLEKGEWSGRIGAHGAAWSCMAAAWPAAWVCMELHAPCMAQLHVPCMPFSAPLSPPSCHSPPPLLHRPSPGGKGKKHDDDDKKKTDCRDIKDRKECRRSRSVCSWCNGKMAPSMCLEESQASFLPPMVFECEKSKRGDDKDDEKIEFINMVEKKGE